MVDQLHASYKTGLLSNAGYTSLDPYLDASELAKYFDVVILSAKVGLIKPDPAIYELICQRLEVKPAEAVFIDDVEAYVEGARAVGLRAIHYQDLEALKRELANLLVATN